MRFPKLKHAFWCMLIILLPTGLMIVGLLLATVLEDTLSEAAKLFLIVGSGVLSLAYLFYELPIMFCLAVSVGLVGHWRRDRLWFACPRNGSSRAEIEQAVLRRCGRFGKDAAISLSEPLQPLCVRHKHRLGRFLIAHTRYDHTIAVYSLPDLDETAYRNILRQAKQIDNRLFLAEKRTRSVWHRVQEYGPPMRALSVVILADRLAPEIPARIRKAQTPVVCAADCTAGRYYLSAQGDPEMSKSDRSYALKNAEKCVFGRLPKSHPENRPPWEVQTFTEDTTMWELWRDLRRDLRNDRKSEKRVRTEMKDGEIRMDKDAVYCMDGGRFAIWFYERSQEDPTLLLITDAEWWDKPSKEMTEADTVRLRTKIRDWLGQKGLQCAFRTMDEALDEPEETDEI